MTRRLTKFRLCSLFLALSLLFGLGIAGCADKDREIGLAPTPSKDTIKYRFQQDTASKVSAEMEEVSVAAFDADWNLLYGAFLYEDDIEDMDRDGGYIVAEAVVPEGTAILAYCFTNDPDDETEDEELEIYVIALEEGKSVYTMADGDYLEVPVLTVYADAGHQTEQYEFTAGGELYPIASASTRGGLEVPAAVFEPVDTGVVAYTADAGTGEAHYVAKAEGFTEFVLLIADCFVINSENGVTVKAAEPEPTPEPSPDPTPEPTPVPSPAPGAVAAWILPEGCELKDGLIYDSEGIQVSDPAELNTELEIAPGESYTGLAVETVIAGDGSVAYKTLTAEVMPAVDSATADHFTAEVEKGAVSVSVSEDAETEETAAITFAAEGYEFRNKLKVTVRSAMRHITLIIPLGAPSPSPSVTPSPASGSSFFVKAAALDAQGNLLKGAKLAEEDMDKLAEEALKNGYYAFEADIPAAAEQFVIMRGTSIIPDGGGEEENRFAPLLGIFIGAEDTYEIPDNELYLYYFFIDGYFYRDEECAHRVYAFEVGDHIYYSVSLQNRIGMNIGFTDVASSDPNVADSDKNGVLTAMGVGECDLLCKILGCFEAEFAAVVVEE